MNNLDNTHIVKPKNIVALDRELLFKSLRHSMLKPIDSYQTMTTEAIKRRAMIIEHMFGLTEGFDARFVFAAMSRLDAFYI